MIQDTDIFNFLRDLILDMKDMEYSAIQLASSFEQMELDSLDFVELQVAVKKRFRVDLLPETFALGAITNVAQLVGFIATEMVATQA
jgi:acyl carrier protein